MIVFTVEDPVFKTEPLFILDCTAAQVQAYLHRRFKVDCTSTPRHAGTMLTYDCVPWRVVWVQQRRDVGVLIHEIFHLVTRICEDKNIPVCAHHPDGTLGDEPAAYLMEFFARAALKRVRR